MLSKVLASLALLLHFACKDAVRVEKEQLIWKHAVPRWECLALGATVSPVTGNLQAKPRAHAFVSS